MMRLILLVSLFAIHQPMAHARNHAKIRHGVSPMYGKTMEIIGDRRVSGRLTELEIFGAGEEEDVVLACYEGTLEDVCEILQTAVHEENDKEEHTGIRKLRLKKCFLNRYDGIVATVGSELESIRLPIFSRCSR